MSLMSRVSRSCLPLGKVMTYISRESVIMTALWILKAKAFKGRNEMWNQLMEERVMSWCPFELN